MRSNQAHKPVGGPTRSWGLPTELRGEEGGEGGGKEGQKRGYNFLNANFEKNQVQGSANFWSTLPTLG